MGTAQARPARAAVGKLRPAEARALVDAQARYDKAKRELDAAKTERDEILAKLRPKFPIGEWVVMAGWAIRITMQRSGDRFRLGDYLRAGHKLTPVMRQFVTVGDESPRLWVKPSGTRPA